MLEHGFVDRIVERSEMKSVLARILHMHDRTKEKTEESTGETEKIESTTQEDTMPKQVRSKGGISAWERGRDRFSYADGENGGCAETAQ